MYFVRMRELTTAAAGTIHCGHRALCEAILVRELGRPFSIGMTENREHLPLSTELGRHGGDAFPFPFSFPLPFPFPFPFPPPSPSPAPPSPSPPPPSPSPPPPCRAAGGSRGSGKAGGVPIRPPHLQKSVVSSSMTVSMYKCYCSMAVK